MKRQINTFIAVVMALVMILSMSGCGVYKTEADEVFSGVMVDAQNERIVVRGDSETMLFATTEGTEYDLLEESELCIGDTIEVDFHKGDDMYIADSVRLITHENHPAVFGGEVTELKKTYLTVQSESLTIVFNRDDKTKIEGDLSKGDSVIVTYEGNLSENPQALSIVVIKENKEKKEKSLHGTVAEIGEKSAIISVDSAHACRLQITSDTTFSGDDTKLKIGDEVFVVYTGTAGDNCVAKSIKISRKQEETKNQTQQQNQKQSQAQAQSQTTTYYVMDGVIDKVSSNGIVIRTSQNSYTFGIVKETRIKNPNYMKAGHKTTITYSGELDKNPVAASIFCSKDTVSEKEKQNAAKAAEAAEKEKTKEDSNTKDNAKADGSSAEKESSKTDDSSEVEDDATSEESSDSKDDAKAEESSTAKDDEKAETKDKEKSSEETNTPETDSVIIKARGEVIEWANPCIFKVDGGATLNLDIIDAEVSGGYIPQAGDQVLITYDKDEMELLVIQLEYRPAKATAMSETDNTVDMNENDASGKNKDVAEKESSTIETDKNSRTNKTSETNKASETDKTASEKENSKTN